MADVAILLCHELIKFLSNLVKKKDKKFSILETEGLDIVLEISWSCEFILELFTPFCKES